MIPGFFIGVAGFIIGIIMGADSVGVTYGVHRGLGIAAVCMGGLQAAALMFRPGTTNRYRKYWKSYHHLVGYGCVVVGVVNVFQGFEVMGIGRSYAKLAYCLVLSTVVGASWVVFCRKAEEEKVLRREEGSDGMLSKGNGGLI
ncbi:uncharacterized protein A4U43_C03F25940 [Asparagus officinalis]|uniref:Cytochrome b561 domain-containing protein n=2 Tax=Asparagus officinalis TaxID=4686 RepID=A0A5P1FD31_ASPOF|nr:uncharacterized protein A4U43_C03F25940 [Asparagus officinalis]